MAEKCPYSSTGPNGLHSADTRRENMRTPRISVLLPVFNDERFVGRAVQSILDQTFADFELLVVNDGSTDNTAEVLTAFRDPRLRIIHQRNAGISAGLNRMIAESCGDFLARMDSDDTCSPHRFAAQVAFLDEHPGVGLVGSACTIIDEDGSHLRDFPVPLTDSAVRRAMVWGNPMVHSSIMMRRSIVTRVGPYDGRLGKMGIEDYDLWLRVLTVSEIANLSEPLVTRVHRLGSTCRVAKSRHYAALTRVQFRAIARRIAPATAMLGLGLNAAKWGVHRALEMTAAPRSARP